MSTTSREETMPSTRPERGIRDLGLLRRDAPSTGRHLDWLRCAELLSDEDCEEIITVCRQFPTVLSATVRDPAYIGSNWPRRRKLGKNRQTQWIYDLLCRVAEEATRTAYGLELTAMRFAPRYLEYEPGVGEFDWHHDYTHDLADAPRKLTIIIQLSAATDYDGGRLQLFGLETEELPTTRGTIIVCPSFWYHRVTPVTRGVRRALVTWVGGPRMR